MSTSEIAHKPRGQHRHYRHVASHDSRAPTIVWIPVHIVMRVPTYSQGVGGSRRARAHEHYTSTRHPADLCGFCAPHLWSPSVGHTHLRGICKDGSPNRATVRSQPCRSSDFSQCEMLAASLRTTSALGGAPCEPVGARFRSCPLHSGVCAAH